MDKNQRFMNLAIKEALKAKSRDEVPIGAIVVLEGKVISRAFNRVEEKQKSTAHAEILAIEKASKKLGSWRLDNCEIYITVEPCAMCAGAIANARIKKVYFGAYEHKSGCAVSKYPVLEDNGLNHSVEWEGGIEGERCSQILKDYFKQKRRKKI